MLYRIRILLQDPNSVGFGGYLVGYLGGIWGVFRGLVWGYLGECLGGILEGIRGGIWGH